MRPVAPKSLTHGSPLRGAALAALLALGLAGCQETVADVPKPERPVLIRVVKFEAQAPERSFVGTIRPRIESDLGFRVAGKVARRLVNVGDQVSAGQPLALLDETDLTLQREQAEAELRAATAALTQTQAELKRVQTLRADGWSTAANLDRQLATSEEARGRLERARRSLALAQNALSYATLAADTAGVVTAAMIEPGQVLAAGQTAVRLARNGDKDVLVAIPEALVGQAREGAASLSLWSDPQKRYAARLREFSPQADPATRTYQARFAVPDIGEAAQLGMTATLLLEDPAHKRIVRLPLSALYNQGAGPSVWVVEIDGRIQLRPIEVVGYEAQDVLVSKGLKDGEQVVTLGVQKLDAGQRVRIVQAYQF